MSRKTKILYKYIAVASWMLLIFWFSSQGHAVSSGQSMGIVDAVHHVTGVTLPEVVVRKSAHTFLYAVLGILLYTLIREYIRQARRGILIAVTIACMYAMTDELHQAFTGGRSAQITDVLLDTAAALIAVGLWVLVTNILLYKKQ